MWLANKIRKSGVENSAAVGEVTIGGTSMGVYLSGERRGVTSCMPGGYYWSPSVGDELLVIKCEDGERMALGMPSEEYPVQLEAGEVYICSAGGASIWLKNNGQVKITGSVNVTGALKVNGNTIS